MNLWPHQIYGINETIRVFNSGVPSICLTSPTGGGKSQIIIELIRHYVSLGRRINVYSARRLWTAQLAKQLTKAGIRIGVRAADWEAWEDSDAPVQLCSTQTETARVVKRNNGAKFPPADLLIIDEIHVNKGDSMTNIVRHYEKTHGTNLLGISATPLGVSHLCDHLIIAGTNSELRACGALVPAKVYEPMVFDLPKIRRSQQLVFSQSELDHAVKAIWSQHIVGGLFEHWNRLNPHAKPSLCMAPGVREAISVAKEFESRGAKAAALFGTGVYVDGQEYRNNSQETRDEIFDRFLSGEIKMLTNRFVLREAVDLPAAEFLQLATPIASLLSYLQVVGRVLRASPATNKTHAIICDHANSVRLHGSPNQDRDDDWRKYFHNQDTDMITKDRAEKLHSPDKKEPEPITCAECGQVRARGVICPGCGHQSSISVRKVIQEDGRLRISKGDVFKRRNVRYFDDTTEKWRKCVYRCKRAKRKMSFKQARALFKYENGYYPPEGLPLMPLNAADWSRKICDMKYHELVPDPARTTTVSTGGLRYA